MFSCEYNEIFKNSFFHGTSRVAASVKGQGYVTYLDYWHCIAMYYDDYQGKFDVTLDQDGGLKRELERIWKNLQQTKQDMLNMTRTTRSNKLKAKVSSSVKISKPTAPPSASISVRNNAHATPPAQQAISFPDLSTLEIPASQINQATFVHLV